MTQWYYMKGGIRHGPIDGPTLKQKTISGSLLPSDKVWCKTLPKWVKASQISGLSFGGNDTSRIPINHNANSNPTRGHPVSTGPIKYLCIYCKSNLESEGKLAGAKDTCPSCGKRVLVPNHSTVGSSSFIKMIPSKVYIGVIGVLALVIGIYTLWCVSRDTWEQDNEQTIKKLSNEAIVLIYKNETEEGYNKYQELCSHIGNRKLEDPSLQRMVKETKDIVLPAKKKLDEQRLATERARLEKDKIRKEKEIMASLPSLEAQADNYLSNKDYPNALYKYQEILDLLKTVSGNNLEYENKIKQKAALPAAEVDKMRQILAARAEEEKKRKQQEAYDREMISKGYTYYKGQWRTKEEVAQAKAIFPSDILREKLKDAYVLGSSVIIKSVRILKSDDVDYPYAIELTVQSDLRAVLNNYPNTATFTFYVNNDLRQSDNYKIRGGEIPKEVNAIEKCVSSVLQEVRRTER